MLSLRQPNTIYISANLQFSFFLLVYLDTCAVQRFSPKRKIYLTSAVQRSLPTHRSVNESTGYSKTTSLRIYILAEQPLHSFSGFSDMTVKTSENGCKSCISMLFTQQQIIIISQMVSACEWPAECLYVSDLDMVH